MLTSSTSSIGASVSISLRFAFRLALGDVGLPPHAAMRIPAAVRATKAVRYADFIECTRCLMFAILASVVWAGRGSNRRRATRPPGHIARLLAYFRRAVLAGTRLASATIGTIRLRLLQVAERVVRSVRRVWFHLAVTGFSRSIVAAFQRSLPCVNIPVLRPDIPAPTAAVASAASVHGRVEPLSLPAQCTDAEPTWRRSTLATSHPTGNAPRRSQHTQMRSSLLSEIVSTRGRYHRLTPVLRQVRATTRASVRTARSNGQSTNRREPLIFVSRLGWASALRTGDRRRCGDVSRVQVRSSCCRVRRPALTRVDWTGSRAAHPRQLSADGDRSRQRLGDFIDDFRPEYRQKPRPVLHHSRRIAEVHGPRRTTATSEPVHRC